MDTPENVIDWFAERIDEALTKEDVIRLIAKAKEMERQKLSDMYEKGRNDERELGAELLREILKNK